MNVARQHHVHLPNLAGVHTRNKVLTLRVVSEQMPANDVIHHRKESTMWALGAL
jgi:hypothetical protein